MSKRYEYITIKIQSSTIQQDLNWFAKDGWRQKDITFDPLADNFILCFERETSTITRYEYLFMDTEFDDWKSEINKKTLEGWRIIYINTQHNVLHKDACNICMERELTNK